VGFLREKRGGGGVFLLYIGGGVDLCVCILYYIYGLFFLRGGLGGGVYFRFIFFGLIILLSFLTFLLLSFLISHSFLSHF